YIAAFSSAPDEAVRSQLQHLLAVEGRAPSAQGIIVVPRLGTVSAWSSKAEDIARNSGLKTLVRLERGLVYRFLAPEPDSDVLIKGAVLHDPMTESVITDWSLLNALFEIPARRHLRRVPLTRQGVAALHDANRDWGLAL